jgi:NAD(P)H-hydrate epimerase
MALSREQARALDRKVIDDAGVPGVVLMENAGRGAAELLLRLGVTRTVFVCCGKGNNGGDGLVIARHLDNHRIPVRVLLFAQPDELTGDAALQWHIVQRLSLSVHACTGPLDEVALAAELHQAEWIVDALFGTGLTGPVRPPFDRVIACINAAGRPVLAVDIPSGLNADTGAPMGPTIRARHTVTFVATKRGFDTPAAKDWLGEVHVADIGIVRRTNN